MNELESKKALPYIAHIIRSVIYGSTFLFTVRLLSTTSILDVLALRFLLSTIAFLILIAFKVIHVSFQKKHLKNLILTAFFEPILYFLFETFGLKGATTMMAGILATITPFLSILFDGMFFQKKINSTQKLFMLLRVGGAVIIFICSSKGDGKNTWWGIIFLILSHIAGSFFTVFSKFSSKEYHSMEITFFTTAFGAVVFNAVNVIRHFYLGTITTYFKPLFNFENFIGFIALSVFSSVIATAFNNYALSRLQLSYLSAMSGLSTIVTVVLGVACNNETLYWYHIVGMLLILLGAVGVNFLATGKRMMGVKR